MPTQSALIKKVCLQIDYKTPSGQKTSGTSFSRFSKLPQVLGFQLHRVVFDPVQKCEKKICRPFAFEETIVLNR
jgi:hypothetical protein